jgi:hypothetical protein
MLLLFDVGRAEVVEKKIFRPWAGMFCWTVLGLWAGPNIVIRIDGGA